MALGIQDVFHFCALKIYKARCRDRRRGGVGGEWGDRVPWNTMVVVGAQELEQVPMCSGICKTHCLHLRELLAGV